MEVQSGNDRMSAPSTAAWPRPAHDYPAVCVPARVLQVVGTGVDPVTSRFSGRSMSLAELPVGKGKCARVQLRC